MTDLKTLEFTEKISAPVEQVYAAFKNSIAWESWFSDFAEVDLKESGRFYCWWNVGYYASGLFSKVVENERIVFTWNGLGEPHDTLVEVTFATKDNATEVKILHGGIGTGSEWTERISAYERGWETGLTNLKSVMETGLDKRIYDRPMLGIMPGELIDTDKAAEKGLPVDYGIFLSGTLDGMGAEAAGLQKNDILISLNQKELKTYQDFAPALVGTKAGDVVEVIFYREGEKHVVQMELSRRQIPEAPNSAVEMGNAVAKIYEEVAAEREALFEGVSESQAAARPGPEAWSAKETLVHLLYTERWLHLAISCAVSGQRTGGFANQLELIAAMADTYPLEELLSELRRSEQVTVASLIALPDDFVADKRQFLGLSNSIQFIAQHTRDHFDQIKEAIEAAG
jgi:uncharacterized protein YndB with AHSA1/START domain